MSQLGKILLLFSGVSFVSFALVRFLLGAWVPFNWLALAFFVFFLAGAVWKDRAFYHDFFGMKTTKQGLNMGTMILLVFSILAAVNFLGARRYLTWDLSANKVNSLSDQSLKMLDGLKDDLKVIYFYKEGARGVEQARKMFIDLIKKYQDASSKMKLEFVEINERPDLTEKYGIKSGAQQVILDYQGRNSLIVNINEQEITGGIVKVTREQAKKIYVLAGHGELGLESQEDGDSASFLKALLEGNRYEVKSFSFSNDGAIPKDTDALMILGPKQQFSEGEVKALETFLIGGGSLLLAMEPNFNVGLAPLLQRVGVKASNNYIISVIRTEFGVIPEPKFTRGSVFSTSHPVTKPFGRSEFTVFRLPQALERTSTNPPEGLVIDDLVRTNENSFAVTSLTANEQGPDGPYTIVMSVKGKMPGASDSKEFNLVVAGDRDFLNDQSLYQNLNRDLLLNSVAALAKEENMISITPKEVGRTELVMLDTQFVLYIFLFAIPLPLLFYALSFVQWWRRRNA